MSKILSKIFGDGASKLVDSIGKTVDGIVTSDDERMKAKSAITSLVTGFFEKMASMQKEVIMAEASGSWLQRSWRPVLMLGFGFIVMYSKFLAPAFGLPNTELEPDFWQLLRIGIGGYVIGRSAEKLGGKLADNIDKIPGRKSKDK